MIVVVPGEPQPKQRARTFSNVGADGKRFSRTVTPDATVAAERLVAQTVKYAVPGIEPIEDREIKITLEFHMGPGRRGRKPDLDNLTKLVLDACNGIVWKDDRLIVRIEAMLDRRSSDPRTVIMWEEA